MKCTLSEKCLYLEFFWSVFSRIGIEYVDLLCKSPYYFRMRKNMDQKNSDYGHLLDSVNQ